MSIAKRSPRGSERPLEGSLGPLPEELDLAALRSDFGRAKVDRGGFREPNEDDTMSAIWAANKRAPTPDDVRAVRSNSYDNLAGLGKGDKGRGTSMDALPPKSPPPLPLSPGGHGDNEPLSSRTLSSDSRATSSARPSRSLSEMLGWGTSGALEATAEGLSAGAAQLEAGAQLAVVLLTPEAAGSKACVALVKKMLGESKVQVLGEQSVKAKAIEEGGLVDGHYRAMATRALSLPASKLKGVPPESQAAFLERFGVDWAAAVEQGLVLNASEAMKKLGLSAEQLGQKWAVIPGDEILKFESGFYCGRLDIEDDPTSDVGSSCGATEGAGSLSGNSSGASSVGTPKATSLSSKAPSMAPTCEGFVFVINGFYPDLRKKWTAHGSKVKVLSVKFRAQDLSWTDFRTKVVGASTNPFASSGKSIRSALAEKWKTLGLKEPRAGAALVHASSSPLAALFERMNWLGVSAASSDPFGRVLLSTPSSTPSGGGGGGRGLRNGLSESTLAAWRFDPLVYFEGAHQRVLGLHRDLDSQACLKRSQAVAHADAKHRGLQERAESRQRERRV
mmetsp:Transcript_10237/g.23657  ORF Transcript_10237/g.23657 Transcript_10237/m.23657 type:complete len:562 (+) Transcript_10237:249-1934(+)